MFQIPYEIQSFINANLNNFVASLYIEETEVDVLKHLNQNLQKDFSYFKFDFSVKEIIRHDGFILYKLFLVKIPCNPDNDMLKGEFFLIKDVLRKIYFIISPNSKNYLDKAIHSFMEIYFYNRISRVYLTSKEIFQILDLLEKHLKKQILTKWCTGKRLFSDRPDTISRWGDELISFRECFDIANKEKMSINWIRVVSYDEQKNRKLKMDISRECNISSNLSNIDEIYGLLNVVIQKGEKDLELLKNKEIKEDRPATPIVLEYKQGILQDTEIKTKLIEKIEEYGKCNYSVIHGGNPHIYMYIKDSIDSSSFSIRSIGADKILVIPQLKSTYAALMRFIHFLTENFTEYETVSEIKHEIQN